jgi:hypothetical protein
MEDFLNGGTPEIVNLTYGYNGEASPAARVRTNKIGVYGQDEWAVTPNFKFTYGVRIDGLFFNNGDLMTNKAIYNLDYNGRHIDTGKWPSANLIFSPRAGFTWDVLGDKSLKVRGGTGLFAGNLPLVFFTNMPTNSGMVQYQAMLNANTKVYDAKTKKEAFPYTGPYTTGADATKTEVNEAIGNKADGVYALVIAPVIKQKLYAKARYDLYRQSGHWGDSRTQYEVGANYLFNKNIQLNAEYARINDRTLASHNYDMVDVQLDFRF